MAESIFTLSPEHIEQKNPLYMRATDRFLHSWSSVVDPSAAPSRSLGGMVQFRNSGRTCQHTLLHTPRTKPSNRNAHNRVNVDFLSQPRRTVDWPKNMALGSPVIHTCVDRPVHWTPH